MKTKKTSKLLWVVYSIFFFFNLHLAFGLYINSSFLSEAKGFSDHHVGLIFAAGALGGATITLLARKLSQWVGSARRLFFLSIIGALVALFGFVFADSPILVAVLFAGYWTLSYLFNFIADILVEGYSDDSTTGDTRGVFLTIAGLGTMLAPFAAGKLTSNDDGFTMVYMAAAVLLLVSMAGMLIYRKKLKEPKFNKVGIVKGLKGFFKSRNLSGAFGANFLLQFFFSWMIIYVPIHLSQNIGLGWDKIGLIFTVMLLPFVLIEIPLGKIADRLLGEKEILQVGTILMMISTAVLALVTSSSVILWMGLLLGTRIGASAVQVASEAYFFKQVSERDLSHISIFRLATPLAFTMGPLVGTAILAIPGFQLPWLFLVLPVISAFSIPLVARVTDTK